MSFLLKKKCNKMNTVHKINGFFFELLYISINHFIFEYNHKLFPSHTPQCQIWDKMRT
jgi:hypothetical protein